jgi:hypothetical protein
MPYSEREVIEAVLRLFRSSLQFYVRTENDLTVVFSPACSKPAGILSFGLPDKTRCDRKNQPPVLDRPLLVDEKIMSDGAERAPVQVKGILKSTVVEDVMPGSLIVQHATPKREVDAISVMSLFP